MEFFNPYLLANYLSYGLLIALGARLKPAAHWLKLVAGGVLGALIFYLISNTAAWLQLAAYSKTFAGWLQALTVGLPGYPPTWSFLLKTLMSGGLFTGLFVGAMRATQASESAREKEAVEPSPSEEPAEADPKPQEAGS